jgi:hypothetical protein
MFAQTADAGHKVMRFFLSLSGNVPRKVPEPSLSRGAR